MLFSQIPFGVVAVEIKLRKRRIAVADRHQCQRLVATRHLLGHNAERAVGELVDTPELFVGSCETVLRNDFTAGSGRQ